MIQITNKRDAVLVAVENKKEGVIEGIGRALRYKVGRGDIIWLYKSYKDSDFAEADPLTAEGLEAAFQRTLPQERSGNER